MLFGREEIGVGDNFGEGVCSGIADNSGIGLAGMGSADGKLGDVTGDKLAAGVKAYGGSSRCYHNVQIETQAGYWWGGGD